MANSSVRTKKLLGIIQQVYTLFSSSTQQWKILHKCIQLTVQLSCDTKWEARIESVKALRYQIEEVYDVLVEVSKTTNDVKC